MCKEWIDRLRGAFALLGLIVAPLVILIIRFHLPR